MKLFILNERSNHKQGVILYEEILWKVESYNDIKSLMLIIIEIVISII
jgi:hypothetical protein